MKSCLHADLSQQLSEQLPSGAELLQLQVLVCGAELFTSNAALMPVAYYEKKASLQQVLTCSPVLSSLVITQAL